MRTVGPTQVSVGQACVEVDVFPVDGRIPTLLGALLDQVVVTVEDVVVKPLTVPHGGHALACESGPAVDPNEVSGLRCERALDYLPH